MNRDNRRDTTGSQEAGESVSAAFAQAGSRLRRRDNGEVDVLHAVGGVRGIVEALLPGFLFLTVYLVSHNLVLSLILAGAVTAVFALIRLLQRGSLMQALSGMAGLAICAIVALRSGNAADYYVPGLWINAAYALGITASILFRYPLLGFFYGFVRDELNTWRTDPARYRAYRRATWVLVAMFVVRLAVQVPLYLADNVAGLGVARLIMGVPLYAAVLWLTWMMTRKVATV